MNKKLIRVIAVMVIICISLSACSLTSFFESLTSNPTPFPTETAQGSSLQGSGPSTTITPGVFGDSPQGQLEVYSWWTSTSGADSLSALIKTFNQMYPNVAVSNLAGTTGTGTDTQTILANLISSPNPPDSWQTYAGMNTNATYAAPGQIQPLDPFFMSTGLGNVVPPAYLALISQNGHPYSVPLDVERANVLWYNPKVLKAAGITADPQTAFPDWVSFFSACDKVKASGKTCLALGPGLTSMLLFENVMIGSLGVDKWAGLWTTPPATDWNGPEVKAAIATFAKALSYTNSNAATLPDWQSTVKYVTDGNAAFVIMCDWSYKYLTDPSPAGLGLTPHQDFDWSVSPGTYGIFDFLSDSFVLPVKTNSLVNTTAWLSAVASKLGQEAFNPQNGSICPRTDCDPTLYNEYSRGAANDWKTSKLVGSLYYGVVASPAWVNSIQTAVIQFGSSPKDLTAQTTFQHALAADCTSAGACK